MKTTWEYQLRKAVDWASEDAHDEVCKFVWWLLSQKTNEIQAVLNDVLPSETAADRNRLQAVVEEVKRIMQ